MAWTASHIFRQFAADMLTPTASMTIKLGTGTPDTPKAALFNNTITPDENATAALSAYNAATSQWLTANEVWQAGQWAQAGVALSGIVWHANDTADAVWYDANDTASGTAATLANVYGVLVYDDTVTTPVADQGLCFNYFGGVQSVTAGQFTSVWNAAGVFRFTV